MWVVKIVTKFVVLPVCKYFSMFVQISTSFTDV